MFGKRKDGTLIRGLDPIAKATPYFMPQRTEALNMMEESIRVENLDEYIKSEAEKGNTFNYMHVVIAALVRIFALRPALNRFISNCKLYQRNDIQLSITIKKSLADDGEECLVKMHFTGRESIYEVKAIIDKAIADNLKQSSGNGTEKGARILGMMPGFMFRFGLWVIKTLDRLELLPKAILDASPFHTGIFLSNLKSIKNDAIFHHLYNFGNCSVFVVMGKEKMVPVVEDNERLAIGKVMNLGVTMDERICDGFYFAKSLRIFKRILQDPTVLNDPLALPETPTKKEKKADKKERRRQEKRDRKAEKSAKKAAIKTGANQLSAPAGSAAERAENAESLSETEKENIRG